MNPFRCFACFEPCIEFPQDFKALLIDFIRDLNKFQPCSLSCSELNNLIFCQSCWIHFMRVHKLDRQLSLKQKAVEVKVSLLSAKIRRDRRTSVETRNNPTSCKDLNVQISVPPSSAQEEPIEVESADKSDGDSQKAQPVQAVTIYEDKWLPTNLVIPTSSHSVKRLSEVDFMYMDKYPFKATDKGFKCGLCPEICSFYKCTLWNNITIHMKTWHRGNHRVRRRHAFIQIAPNHYQYGKYKVEKIGGNYRCEQCGVMKEAGPRHKASNIIKHINYKHEDANRTYVCEYCGRVFNYPVRLQEHKITEHEKTKEHFPCSDCDRTFASRSKASVHRHLVHLQRGEFVCESCGKRFNHKSALRKHAAWAHNRQMFKCQDCGKIFGSENALYVHRYSHTGKKYTCDVCGMDFTQHYSVTRHKKTAHPS